MTEFGFTQTAATEINVPRVQIAGTHSGVGVSTVMLGLMVGLKRLGISLAAAKVGPSLIETTHFRRITGRLAHSLDPWMLSKLQMVNCFARLASGAEFLLIESEKGLFDKKLPDYNLEDDAAVAGALRMPLVLVVDAQGSEESIAAVVRGFMAHSTKVEIHGVIANRITSDSQNERIKAAIQSLNGPRYLGGLPLEDTAAFDDSPPEGASGNKTLLQRNRLISVGELVSLHIDLDAFQEIGKKSGVIEVPNSVLGGSSRICRIAVADDAAFHLTVQDNLDLIRRAGGDLVAFSPLADYKLPPRTHGIYLPSGYVHLYAADLNANSAMLQNLQAFARDGGIIYAEGSSLSYLCRKIMLTSGETYQMTGILPAIASCILDEDKYFEPTYCEVTATAETPITNEGDVVRGLRDSRWSIRLDEQTASSFELRDRSAMLEDGEENVVPANDGLAPTPNIIATSAQLHWSSVPSMATHFVKSVSAVEDQTVVEN